MKLRRVLLAVIFAIGGGVPLLWTSVKAEQGTSQKTEETLGAHAGADCCQMKEVQGGGQSQTSEAKSCCENSQESHSTHAGVSCCQQQGTQGGEHAQQGAAKSCCDHGGSHGEGELKGESH